MRYVIHTARERRLAVAKLQGGFFCYYCDEPEPEAPASSLAVDHVVPRCRGGSDDLRNLVLACNACNIRKLDRDVDMLIGFGHETLAQRVAGVQAMRANWGPDEVRAALAQDVPGIDPGYDKYERFLTETPTAKVINAALTYAGMSNERLRRKAGLAGWTLDTLRHEKSKGSVRMWKRLSDATGYPIDEFLKIHQKWKSTPDTPQRELEYAAARQGLNPSAIARMIGVSLNKVLRVHHGGQCLKRFTPATEKAWQALVTLNDAAWQSLKTRLSEHVASHRAQYSVERKSASPSKQPKPRGFSATGFRDGATPPRIVKMSCQGAPLVFNTMSRLYDDFLAYHQTQIRAAAALQIERSYFSTLKRQKWFPSIRVLKTMLAVSGRHCAGAFLLEVEQEACARLELAYPPSLQRVFSLDMLAYLRHQTYTQLSTATGLHGSNIGVWIRINRGFERHLSPLSKALSVSPMEVAMAFEKAHITWQWRKGKT